MLLKQEMYWKQMGEMMMEEMNHVVEAKSRMISLIWMIKRRRSGGKNLGSDQ